MVFRRHQLFVAAGVGTGVGVCAGFGAGFFAAATAGGVVGRGDGNGAFAVGAAGCGGDGVGAAPGSGVMMLTGGVEAAEGKSALVGLPVVPGDIIATGAGAGAAAGAFQEGA